MTDGHTVKAWTLFCARDVLYQRSMIEKEIEKIQQEWQNNVAARPRQEQKSIRDHLAIMRKSHLIYTGDNPDVKVVEIPLEIFMNGSPVMNNGALDTMLAINGVKPNRSTEIITFSKPPYRRLDDKLLLMQKVSESLSDPHATRMFDYINSKERLYLVRFGNFYNKAVVNKKHPDNLLEFTCTWWIDRYTVERFNFMNIRIEDWTIPAEERRFNYDGFVSPDTTMATAAHPVYNKIP